jgi:hypothetical protein
MDLKRLPNLRSLDISGANPLDFTSDLYWLEDHDIELLHAIIHFVINSPIIIIKRRDKESGARF